MALLIYRRGICDCGFHESLTADKRNHFTFDERICPVCQGHARFARIQSETDERIMKAMGESPPARSVRPSDGRRTFARTMSAAEVAEAKAQRTNGPAA